MINIDKSTLEKRLGQVCLLYYNWEELYFIIESINLVFDVEDEDDYSYMVKGRAGDELKEDSCIHFEIQIDPKWSLDFIQGYFYRELELLSR